MRFRAFQVCGDDNYLSSIESSSFGPPHPEEERYASSSYCIIRDFSCYSSFGPLFFVIRKCSVFFLLFFGKGETKGVKVSSPFGPKKKKEKKNGRRLLLFYTSFYIYIFRCVCLHTSKKK